MQITVPAASVTFELAGGDYPNFYEIRLFTIFVGDLWHGLQDDVTCIETAGPFRSDDIFVHGPDREQRTTEALTQLAARLFPVASMTKEDQAATLRAQQFYMVSSQTIDGKYWLPGQTFSCVYPRALEDAKREARLIAAFTKTASRISFYDGEQYLEVPA